jgi:hypothetical protein
MPTFLLMPRGENHVLLSHTHTTKPEKAKLINPTNPSQLRAETDANNNLPNEFKLRTSRGDGEGEVEWRRA